MIDTPSVCVIHIGFEPMTSSLSRKRSEPTELMNHSLAGRTVVLLTLQR